MVLVLTALEATAITAFADSKTRRRGVAAISKLCTIKLHLAFPHTE